MKIIARTFAATGLTLAVLAAGAAFAQDDDAAERDEALTIVDTLDRLNEGQISDEHQTRLLLLANDAAVAAVCQGFALDPQRTAAVFEGITPPDWADMSEEQRLFFGQHVLVWYGMAVGAAIAEAVEDVSDTCAIAALERSNPTVEHHWVAAAQ